MVDLQISSGYERAEGSPSRERPWWHRLWGIEAIGENGKENLAYLQEKLYQQGNALVPFMYTIPKDAGVYRQWVDSYYQHLAESVTEDLGISAYWKSRKMFTRVMPLFFSMGIGGLALILSVPGLVQNLTAVGLVLYFFKGFTSIFFGFIVSTSFSWYFIRKGWTREVELYSKLHGQIDDFDTALSEVAPQTTDETPEELRKSMIVAQAREVEAGFEAELGPGSGASADLILVGVGSDKQRADFIRQALVDKGLIRRDVPVYAFMNDNSGNGVEIGGSADAFSKAYSLIDPEKDLGGIIQSLSDDATVASLNPDGAGPSASMLRKKVGQARIIVLYAGGSTLEWMSQPLPLRDLKFRGAALNTLQLALGNGYRVAQVLHSQGRGGVVNLHADGAYLGPLKDMQEGISVVSSWTSQDQMNTQKLGLLLTEDERIRKYYDHFNPHKVGSWLEREIMAGRYQMTNMQKRQMTISSGILITSFTDEKNFVRFCSMLKGVREYLIQTSNARGFSTRIAPDLLVPMVMMSQQENIYTYLEAYLKQAITYAGQVGNTYPDEKEARDFYLGLFKVIDRGYRNVYPGVFNVQIQYPHESVYSHGPVGDFAGLLRTYWGFNDSDLEAPAGSGPSGNTPFAGPPVFPAGPHSSANTLPDAGAPAEEAPLVVPQEALPPSVPPVGPDAAPAAVGGIDLRGPAIAVATGPAAQDTQWEEIESLVKSGITPSGERLKEYLRDGWGKHDLPERMDNIRGCIIDIFRSEEDTGVQENQPLIGLLELVETNSHPAENFLASLARIEVPNGASEGSQQ
jgi:hypothetical protein